MFCPNRFVARDPIGLKSSAGAANQLARYAAFDATDDRQRKLKNGLQHSGIVVCDFDVVNLTSSSLSPHSTRS